MHTSVGVALQKLAAYASEEVFLAVTLGADLRGGDGSGRDVEGSEGAGDDGEEVCEVHGFGYKVVVRILRVGR